MYKCNIWHFSINLYLEFLCRYQKYHCRCRVYTSAQYDHRAKKTQANLLSHPRLNVVH